MGSTSEKEELKDKARKALKKFGWNNEAIQWALDPTPAEAQDRGAIPLAEVNPEQHAAIKVLERKGWAAHDMAQAIPVPESEITKVLLLTKLILEDKEIP